MMLHLYIASHKKGGVCMNEQLNSIYASIFFVEGFHSFKLADRVVRPLHLLFTVRSIFSILIYMTKNIFFEEFCICAYHIF